MTDSTKYISDWIARYLKNRDLMFRRIESLEQKDDLLIIKLKSGEETTHYIEPFIKDTNSLLKRLGKDKPVGLVVCNTSENFKFLKDNWKKLIEIKSLVIYFVNPFSKIDKKWVVFPRTHALIADEESLEGGLNSMFNTVEKTTEEEIEKIISS